MKASTHLPLAMLVVALAAAPILARGEPPMARPTPIRPTVVVPAPGKTPMVTQAKPVLVTGLSGTVSAGTVSSVPPVMPLPVVHQPAVASQLSPLQVDQVIPVLPGEIVAPLPLELTRPLPHQIVRALPGQLIGSLPGEIVQPLPGQIVQPLPGQIVRQ